MAKRKKHLNYDQKREVIVLYNTLQSYTAVAKRMGCAINTVRNVWLNRKNMPELADIDKKIERIKNESDAKLLDHIKSATYSSITKSAMDLLTPENLKSEMANRGIRNLITLIGNSADKVMGVERLELEKRGMAIREKELSLKEKELELRISHPESFHTVQIINDAPKENYVSQNQ